MMWVFSGLLFLSLVAGAAALKGLVYKAEESRQAALKRRLKEVKHTEAAGVAKTLLKDTSLSSIRLLDRLLARAPRTTDLQNLLLQAGSPFNLGVLILLSATLATLGLVAAAVQGFWPGALVLSSAGGLLPVAWLKRRRRRRLAAFDEQFPEAVELMARALRAGHSFSSAVSMVAEELEEPVAGEFAKTFEDYAFGKSLEDALEGLVNRVGLQDVKFFATAVNLQRETGGNLSEILDNIGYIIRERFRLMRHMRALSAEGRLSGTILLLMPPAMLGVLWLTSPGYIQVIFEHPLGRMMLALGGLFQIMGMIVIKRLVKLDV